MSRRELLPGDDADALHRTEEAVARPAGGDDGSRWFDPANRRRLAWFAGFLCVLVLAFSGRLTALVGHALDSDLHSHVVLVPFVSLYLLWLRREKFEAPLQSSVVSGLVAALAGFGALALPRAFGDPGSSVNDSLAASTLAFLLFLVAGGFFLLGRARMWEAAFPVAFLIFLIPLPDAAAAWLERQSQFASADWAHALFDLGGVPALRDGNVFRLPGIVIEVARECSGIRSSWVLFITAVLAAHLFLRGKGSRLLLVAAVIPLAILRNAFRIFTIGWLCVERGPHMIDSPIHHRGGPVFFALSLVPFFALLIGLRALESRRKAKIAKTT